MWMEQIWVAVVVKYISLCAWVKCSYSHRIQPHQRYSLIRAPKFTKLLYMNCTMFYRFLDTFFGGHVTHCKDHSPFSWISSMQHNGKNADMVARNRSKIDKRADLFIHSVLSQWEALLKPVIEFRRYLLMQPRETERSMTTDYNDDYWCPAYFQWKCNFPLYHIITTFTTFERRIQIFNYVIFKNATSCPASSDHGHYMSFKALRSVVKIYRSPSITFAL